MTENDNNKDEFIEIAIITGAHSLDGKLRIFLLTDIKERFNPGNTVYLNISGNFTDYKVKAFAIHKNSFYRLSLSGISSREEAEALKGIRIYIKKSEAEKIRTLLDNTDFLYIDLIGCTVIFNDKEFGKVTDILEAGGGSILIITKDGKEFMVPFVRSMVDTGDINNKIIHINPVEGLLDF